jgi:hypothetical protein
MTVSLHGNPEGPQGIAELGHLKDNLLIHLQLLLTHNDGFIGLAGCHLAQRRDLRKEAQAEGRDLGMARVRSRGPLLQKFWMGRCQERAPRHGNPQLHPTSYYSSGPCLQSYAVC